MSEMIYLNEENRGACYMVRSDSAAVIFDPGMAYFAETTMANIRKVLGSQPVDAVFLTHSHYDHVAAVPYIRQCWPNARVYAADYAKKVLVKPVVRETIMKLSGEAAEVNQGKIPEPYPADLLYVDEMLEDGDEVEIGDIRIRAIETIGHTRCSLSYLIDDKILLASETLGVIHADGEYMPQFLIDYGKALESVRRCRRLGAEQLWLPHYGLAGRPDNKLWQWFEDGIVNAKETIIGILKTYVSPEERMEAMARRFWQPKRKGELPRSAFELNAQAMLKTIEREFL